MKRIILAIILTLLTALLLTGVASAIEVDVKGGYGYAEEVPNIR